MIKTTRYRFEQADKKKVCKYLIDKDMSIRGLARELGFSPAYMCDILNGYRQVKQETMDKIIQFLGKEVFENGD